MSREHKLATIRLKESESRFRRRNAEKDGTVAAEKAYRAAKADLSYWRSEWRRTRPAPSHTANGSATATPETLHIKSTPRQGE